jgi:glycosyltransferase involved in cell wall biosynthesis
MARIFNDLGATFRHIVIALDGNTDAAHHISKNIDCTVAATANRNKTFIASLCTCTIELVRRRPDVLVTYNWGAIEWALANRLITRFPHIHHEAGFGKEEAMLQLRRRVLFRRWALPRSTVVVPSRTLENIVLRDWCLPKEKVLYVPNGIDITRFNIAHLKLGHLPTESRPLIVGTLAPLRPEKNVGRLIKAFGIALGKANLRLLIAGEGSERAALEKLVQEMELGSRVTFLGYVDHPEAVLSEMDIFALSSDTEQMPNSLLEAMGMALPVAAMDVGDVRQMVAFQNHPFLARRDHIDGLAEAIVRLVALGPARLEIGRANRARVHEEYRHEVMVSRWETILVEAARTNRQRSNQMMKNHDTP